MSAHIIYRRRCEASPARGLTLVELLIVLVILAVIALFVAPTSEQRDRELVRNAARLLAADIDYARLSSLGSGSDPTVLAFDSSKDSYWLASLSDPLQPLEDPAGPGAYTTRYGHGRASALAGVTIDAIENVPDERVVFTRLGSLDQGDDPTIVLRANNARVWVIINADTGESVITK